MSVVNVVDDAKPMTMHVSWRRTIMRFIGKVLAVIILAVVAIGGTVSWTEPASARGGFGGHGFGGGRGFGFGRGFGRGFGFRGFRGRGFAFAGYPYGYGYYCNPYYYPYSGYCGYPYGY
jgi:hypothetical protein